MRLNVWGWRCRVGAAFHSGRGLHGECVAEYQRHLAGQHGRQARPRACVGNLAQWDACKEKYMIARLDPFTWPFGLWHTQQMVNPDGVNGFAALRYVSVAWLLLVRY